MADGEFLVLVGPSGCGKSTALRTAAGLEDVTDGSIHIGDREVTHVRPAERNVSMVFQSYALFPHLSVEENIGFGLRALEGPAQPGPTQGGGRRRARRLREIARAQAVSSSRAGSASVSRLPGRSFASLTCTCSTSRSRISTLSCGCTRAELRRLHQRVGTTMVYVTHDQVEALTLGDRVAVLDQGVLQQLGRPTTSTAGLRTASWPGS